MVKELLLRLHMESFAEHHLRKVFEYVIFCKTLEMNSQIHKGVCTHDPELIFSKKCVLNIFLNNITN